MKRFQVLALTFAVAAAGVAFANAGSSDDALGAWVPDPDTGFVAWQKGQTAKTTQYDYFVCGNAAPSEKKDSFYYAGSACPLVKSGTAFVYGGGEPIRSNALYDAAHKIVLYDKGCCAWRGFALTSGVAPPPKTVSSADLSAVRTMRGIRLGMSMAQVEAIYGTAKPHDTKNAPGVTTLSYTTMKGTPERSEGDACGQFQSFSFRQDRLISIELLHGC